jgi:hypothetical protein
MLKKSASGILSSLRGSTYRSVRLAFSLDAALLDSLFEHPEVILVLTTNGNFWPSFGIDQAFPQPAKSKSGTLTCKFSGRQGGRGHLAIAGGTAFRLLC